MRTFTTIARGRGVTTIPAELREAAGVQPSTGLTWVELELDLWLVGPEARRPEEIAPVVASALRAEQSPFPKLMARFFSGEIPQRVGRGHRLAARPAGQSRRARRGEPAHPRRFRRRLADDRYDPRARGAAVATAH